MQKQFLAIIVVCLVLTGCMRSGPPPSLAYGNCTNLCSDDWWKTASTADLKTEIRSGANVNAREEDGDTPLHYAVAYKPTHIKILIGAGAIVNARDDRSSTPLHDAAFYGNAEKIKLLIKSGADIEAREEGGWTPLHSAVLYGKDIKYGKDTSLKVLLKAGANPNTRDNLGKTPLHAAVQEGHIIYVRILLNAGADPNVRDNYTDNPLRAADKDAKTSPQWSEIANLLKTAGSDTKKNATDITKKVACGTSDFFTLGIVRC